MLFYKLFKTFKIKITNSLKLMSKEYEFIDWNTYKADIDTLSEIRADRKLYKHNLRVLTEESHFFY